MKKTLISSLVVVLSLVFTLCGCGDGKSKKVDQSVIDNLQKAYNGESNASAKYAMFAEKAEGEGYKSVGALFRAASKSESLHAARHAKVLKSFGVEAKKEIVLPKYTDLKSALDSAFKGETYEIDIMYPEFLADAKAKNAPASVIEAFTFAMDAEKEHAKFYADAMKNMEAWKAPGKKFYVCLVCGYTTNSMPAVCILCASPREKFETFQ